jgi:hypothetical protein
MKAEKNWIGTVDRMGSNCFFKKKKTKTFGSSVAMLGISEAWQQSIERSETSKECRISGWTNT